MTADTITVELPFTDHGDGTYSTPGFPPLPHTTWEVGVEVSTTGTTRAVSKAMVAKIKEIERTKEPTTYGYVGYVTTPDMRTLDVSRDDYLPRPYNTVNKVTGVPDANTWEEVLALGVFTRA